MFIKIQEVMAITTLSRPTIYRMIRNDDFPKQTQITPSRVVWIKEQIDAWMEQKINS